MEELRRTDRTLWGRRVTRKKKAVVSSSPSLAAVTKVQRRNHSTLRPLSVGTLRLWSVAVGRSSRHAGQRLLRSLNRRCEDKGYGWRRAAIASSHWSQIRCRPGLNCLRWSCGGTAEKQGKRHTSHASSISWVGNSCTANKSARALLRSPARPRREARPRGGWGEVDFFFRARRTSLGNTPRRELWCKKHPKTLQDVNQSFFFFFFLQVRCVRLFASTSKWNYVYAAAVIGKETQRRRVSMQWQFICTAIWAAGSVNRKHAAATIRWGVCCKIMTRLHTAWVKHKLKKGWRTTLGVIQLFFFINIFLPSVIAV